MENVKGLLSSQIHGVGIFRKMVNDLSNPAVVEGVGYLIAPHGTTYFLLLVHRLFKTAMDSRILNPVTSLSNARTMVFPRLVTGLFCWAFERIYLTTLYQVSGPSDGWFLVRKLSRVCRESEVESHVRRTVPKSGSPPAQISGSGILYGLVPELERAMRSELNSVIEGLSAPQADRGGEFIACGVHSSCEPEWYLDPRIGGVCNDSSPPHMRLDLLRYLYCACYGKLMLRSPELRDFPTALLPAHKNVRVKGKEEYFDDRFRVQIAKLDPPRPSPVTFLRTGITTFTSIRHNVEVSQVREAARLQTFPDNVLFLWPTNPSDRQVGTCATDFGVSNRRRRFPDSKGTLINLTLTLAPRTERRLGRSPYCST